MSSFWQNCHHRLHRKLSFQQLPVQPVTKISLKCQRFGSSAAVPPVTEKLASWQFSAVISYPLSWLLWLRCQADWPENRWYRTRRGQIGSCWLDTWSTRWWRHCNNGGQNWGPRHVTKENKCDTTLWDYRGVVLQYKCTSVKLHASRPTSTRVCTCVLGASHIPYTLTIYVSYIRIYMSKLAKCSMSTSLRWLQISETKTLLKMMKLLMICYVHTKAVKLPNVLILIFPLMFPMIYHQSY